MKFDELGLAPELLKAISQMGFETPTPVQAQVIPRLLENKGDMVALAQTGTGKTAAFGLPILSMIDHSDRNPQALVLCPTRELCVQITRDMEAFAACSPSVKVVAVYGGTPILPQIRTLEKGVQVIVATPGRMLDILRRKKADLRAIERLILDEADEMLNMGFKEDIEAILSNVPDNAHTLLFSATMPCQVASIARNYMKNPEEITVGQRNAGADNVTHECYVIHQRDRYRALKRIADYYPDMYSIVFCRTRKDTQSVADWLIRDGYNADSLHGDLSQVQRDRVMQKFRSKALQILVATDVAARGLDVNDLTHVINYNLPDDLGSYTHRSGRTGRAGKSGVSIVIVNMREKSKVRNIERMINKVFEYRDVPSGRDICEAQLFSMIRRMKSVEVNDKQIDQFLPDINASLKGMSTDEIIKRFVSLEFNNLLDYYRDAPDLSPGEKLTRSHKKETRKSKVELGPKSKGESDVRMFINIGRIDGLNPKKLAGIISNEVGKVIALKRVDIMKTYSFFEVSKKDKEAVVLSLALASYNGRDVRVEKVDDEKRSKRIKRSEGRKEAYKGRGGKPRKPFKGGKRKPSGSGGSSKGKSSVRKKAKGK